MATTDTSAIQKPAAPAPAAPDALASKAKPDPQGDQQNAAMDKAHKNNPDPAKDAAQK